MEKPRNEGFVLMLPIVHEIVSVARLNKRRKGWISFSILGYSLPDNLTLARKSRGWMMLFGCFFFCFRRFLISVEWLIGWLVVETSRNIRGFSISVCWRWNGKAQGTNGLFWFFQLFMKLFLFESWSNKKSGQVIMKHVLWICLLFHVDSCKEKPERMNDVRLILFFDVFVF